jgi:hypothetical protein
LLPKLERELADEAEGNKHYLAGFEDALTAMTQFIECSGMFERLVRFLPAYFVLWALASAAAALPQPAADEAQRGDELMAILQSGSTNSRGYTAIVHNNGSVTVEQSDISPDAPPMLPAGTVDTSALGSVLSRIGDVSRIPTRHCAKSVSFGTRTLVAYAGKTSGDLQCVASASGADMPPEEEIAKLRQMVANIRAKLPVTITRQHPVRVPLNPGAFMQP